MIPRHQTATTSLITRGPLSSSLSLSCLSKQNNKLLIEGVEKIPTGRCESGDPAAIE